MSHNPYAPPEANLDLPPSTVQPTELEYAGFWRRFGAFWVDAIVLLPLSGINYLIAEKSRLTAVYMIVPGLLIGIAFHIYLVRRYGGTPGKLVLKTRISMTDGAPVTTRAACIRHSVLFVLGALSTLAIALASLRMTDAQYFELSYGARNLQLVKLTPGWYATVAILLQVWIWSEFLVMLFNKKRRALHDYMAGTVVVKTAS